jgi:predicted DCC family thiol-disulfide oxidoreductase YuxK
MAIERRKKDESPAAEIAGSPVVQQPVVLFDGVCNLCNGWVDFIIQHDRAAGIRFAPLQSSAADRLLKGTTVARHQRDTVVLVDGSGLWTESNAVLRATRLLEFPYRLLYGLAVVPRPIRDWVYRLVARNRFRLFGQRETCRVPTPEERERFLGAES